MMELRPDGGVPGREQERGVAGRLVFVSVGTSFLLLAAVPRPASAQAPDGSSVLAPGAQVEKVAGDFIFTEGPTSDAQGNVYFVDQDNNRIMKYDTAGHLTTFMQPSGYANGMTFDNEGHLIAAADEKNEMWSIDVATKTPTVLFSRYDGKLLNGPNDVWVSPTSGLVYFTDPYYPRKWWSRGPKENDEAVYVFDRGSGKMTRVIGDMQQPNGIIGTPDGKQLYVADIRGRQTFVYDIQADGTLANKRLFCPFGSDGMTIDSEGNVYLTTQRAVVVFDKTGKQIETIAVPEIPSNVCFGGPDRQTLFITARTGFYAVKTRVHGVGPQ
jgi:gluconolactonase